MHRASWQASGRHRRAVATARHRAEAAWTRYRVAALGVLLTAGFVASTGTLVAYFEAGGHMPPPRPALSIFSDAPVSARDDPSSAPGVPK